MEKWMEIMVASFDSGEGLAIIQQYWKSGGWLMLPLSIVCFLILFRYLFLRHRLKEALSTPDRSLADLNRILHPDCRDENLLHRLDNVPGAKARIARYLVDFKGRGLSPMEIFDQCRSSELGRHVHSFHILGALVVAAPLLGLLGTVLGMIATFNGVAAGSSETANLVAGGISQALITTQVGLVAALPGTFGMAHLGRLYQRLKNQLDAFHTCIHMAVDHGNHNEEVDDRYEIAC